MKKLLTIGEIGINHNGDIGLAKELILKSKQVGIDVVKFQKRNPDICVPQSQKNIIRSTPWGEMTYLDYKKKIEFEKNEYNEIDKYCSQIGIKWTASVWDIDSYNFIKQYDVPFIKIASACITNIKLLNEIAKDKIPVIISIGMSTIEEIDIAYNILKDNLLAILHCNSSYPAKENELDLNVIPELLKKYKTQIGYSGHELGIMPSIIAYTMGANIIERHITLDKNMWGTDQKCSLEPYEFKEMIDTMKSVDIWKGSNQIQIYETEKDMRKKLRC